MEAAGYQSCSRTRGCPWNQRAKPLQTLDEDKAVLFFYAITIRAARFLLADLYMLTVDRWGGRRETRLVHVDKRAVMEYGAV